MLLQKLYAEGKKNKSKVNVQKKQASPQSPHINHL
jgi:hypothetical protein